MGLFDFFRSKKKKDAAASERVPDDLVGLDDVDLSGTEPPETRYTKEYQDYLASLDPAAACEASPEEKSAESES